MLSRVRRSLDEYRLCWWEYGADGRERGFRVLILMLAVLALVLFFVTAFSLPATGSPLWKGLAAVPHRLKLREFSVALGITSAVLAGACATFVAALAQHVLGRPSSSERDMGPRAVMSLLIAFLAAVIATLTFGCLASLRPAVPKLLHWAAMIAAVVQFLSSAVLIIFTLVLIVPNYTHRRLADELVRVMSWTWVIFFSLLAFLVCGAPGFERASRPLVWLSLFVTMGQIFFAHGYARLIAGSQRYERMLESMRTLANTLFAASAVFTTILLLGVLFSEEGIALLLKVMLFVQVLLWSFALLCLQIWVEGTRKKERYPDFPRDFLAACPRLAASRSNRLARRRRRNQPASPAAS